MVGFFLDFVPLCYARVGIIYNAIYFKKLNFVGICYAYVGWLINKSKTIRARNGFNNRC